MSMSTENRRSWNNSDDVGAAIVDVLRYILAQPQNVGRKCIDDDKFARSLFEDPKIGNIDVPEKVKTVFLEEGERERKSKGSVVIEMPPRGPASGTESATASEPAATMDHDALLSHVMCCYRVWVPASDNTGQSEPSQ